jgi:hypothetical protein
MEDEGSLTCSGTPAASLYPHINPVHTFPTFYE